MLYADAFTTHASPLQHSLSPFCAYASPLDSTLKERHSHPKSALRHLSDVALLRTYIEQDNQDAFTQLVYRHLDLVFTSARRQVRDAHAAEDVTQHVFMKLGAKARLLLTTHSIQGWLLTATRYAALDAIKHRKRRWRRELEAARTRRTSNMSGADLHTAGANNFSARGNYLVELDTILDDALSQLGDTNRDAVIARFFQNKNYRELSQQLGLPEEAARQRVSRSLRRLREILARSGISLPSEELGVALLSRGIMPAPQRLKRAVTGNAVPGPVGRRKNTQ